jgi:hypothetical protein
MTQRTMPDRPWKIGYNVMQRVRYQRGFPFVPFVISSENDHGGRVLIMCRNALGIQAACGTPSITTLNPSFSMRLASRLASFCGLR